MSIVEEIFKDVDKNDENIFTKGRSSSEESNSISEEKFEALVSSNNF